MKSLSSDIKSLKNAGAGVIIVHGGGKAISSSLALHGLKTNFIDGMRVTPKEHIELIQKELYMVNKKITKSLSGFNLDSIGISGEDSKLLICDFLNKEKYGYVGDIKEINSSLLLKALAEGFIPVIATVGVTEDLESVNINADSVASEVAKACDVDELIYLTDQQGVLDHKGDIMSVLATKDIEKIISDGIAIDGMLIKLNSITAYLESSKKNVNILDGNEKNILTQKFLLQKKVVGTNCMWGIV